MIVGFANGCFDMLHDGHRYFLRAVQSQCDRLYVAVNYDESVRRLKGKDRPVDGWGTRCGKIVNLLTENGGRVLTRGFDTEDELQQLIFTICPDVIFKGSDYEGKSVVGSNLARVVLIPRLEGYSTTTEIAKRRA